MCHQPQTTIFNPLILPDLLNQSFLYLGNSHDISFVHICAKHYSRIFDDHFSRIDILSRMWIDAEDFGKRNYDDKEPGYNHGMCMGLLTVKKMLPYKMSATLYEYLHDICIHNVKPQPDSHCSEGKFIYGFCDSGEFLYGINLKTCVPTLKALAEWEVQRLIYRKQEHVRGSQKRKAAQEGYLAYAQYSSEFRLYVISPLASIKQKYHYDTIENTVSSIFRTFYRRIRTANASKENKEKIEDAKLEAIALCCMKLEIGHFFADGNQRTVAFLLLNLLLLQNEFIPCILQWPTCFDGYFGTQDLVRLIKEGMDKFKQYSKGGPKRSFKL